jgi:hypothetical protein
MLNKNQGYYCFQTRTTTNASGSQLSRIPSQFPHRPQDIRTNLLGRFCLEKSDGTDDEGITDEQVEVKTLDWLKRVVIGMNLCPFADLPMRQKKLKIIVLRGSDEEIILAHILLELLERCDTPGTTLVVCPDLYPDDFDKYLAVVNLIEDGLMNEYEEELVGNVQVAPFHPLFQFGGSSPDGADNWTNRSPFPIFHILREEEVTRAVDLLDGDAGKVWRRNVDLLETMKEEMGMEALEQIMKEEIDPESDLARKCKDILRRFRSQLGAQDVTS